MGDPADRATRAVYDATAGAYAAAIGTELNPDFEGPIDRALLGAFVELVGDGAPVADLGCGPGRVAAFLAGHRVRAIGFDLSESMVQIARAAHPGVPFGAGDLAHLPVADGALAGAVCWYSIIHTPAHRLPALFTEVGRTMVPAAPLLVAFQTDDDQRIDREDAHGSGLPLTSFRHHADTVTAALRDAGFDVVSSTVRQPMSTGEPTAQAFVVARLH